MTGIVYHSTVTPNRPHDYVYDQTFTVSSLKDHVKQLSLSQAKDIIINPHFVNMFSALGHYPPAAFSLRSNHLPVGMGNDRSTVLESAEVAGMSRYKYFSRPAIPYKSAYSGQIVYAKQPVPEVVVTNDVAKPSFEPKQTRTIGCQSTFRISETQTDPYSPDYIYDSSLPVPEIIGLSSLVYGKGLPAGKAEVEMIERARVKREWEANLPPVTDEASYEKRLIMMEEMEMREWRDRDLEIKKVQKERLKLLQAAIRLREEKNNAENQKRAERLLQRKMDEKDFLMDKINQKRIKGIRKLQQARMKIDKKITKRDIISDYGNYASGVYAPRARDGLLKTKAETTNQIKLEELSDYKSLEEFQSKLDPNIMEASSDLPLKDTLCVAYRKEQAVKSHLENLSAKLMEAKERKPKAPILRPKFQVKTEKSSERLVIAPTQYPYLQFNNRSEKHEQMEVAAIMLQSLVRGRDVQEKMFEERRKKQEQIDELREKIRFRSISKPKVTADSSSVSQGGESKVASQFEGVIQAEYVGKTLDFLTKELVRLREERRLAAMIKLANRTRRMREAEESGQRQLELIRQQQQDLVFRQLCAVNQESVDSFLEGVIGESINDVSLLQAHELAKEEYIKRFEKDQEAQPSEEQMLDDLVSTFVLPYVEHITTKSSNERDTLPHLEAAKQAIAKALSGVAKPETENNLEDVFSLPPLPK